MVVNLRAKKRLVSRVTGVGIHRIRFDSDHLEDIADAITRENVRGLITANTITFKPIVGTSRGRAQQKKLQKIKTWKKSRLQKLNSKVKIERGARVGKKLKLMVKKIRSLRYLLKEFTKDRGELPNEEFWKLYKMTRGNTVRNKAHLRSLMAEVLVKKS